MRGDECAMCVLPIICKNCDLSLVERSSWCGCSKQVAVAGLSAFQFPFFSFLPAKFVHGSSCARGLGAGAAAWQRPCPLGPPPQPASGPDFTAPRRRESRNRRLIGPCAELHYQKQKKMRCTCPLCASAVPSRNAKKTCMNPPKLRQFQHTQNEFSVGGWGTGGSYRRRRG